jgi:RNA polymerase sigma-70 factor (ECF subfamily)
VAVLMFGGRGREGEGALMSQSPSVPPVAPAAEAVAGRVPAGSEADSSAWFLREVHPHGAPLRAWLRGAFPTVSDVDDVVQESFLRIWKRQAIRPIASAKAFLFQIARRLAVDDLRKKRVRRTDLLGDWAGVNVIEEGRSPVERLSYDEKVDLFAAALAELPPRCREVFVLRKFQGVPQKEIAARLGISERTVESQITRAMKLLEDNLRARGIDGFCHDEKS